MKKLLCMTLLFVGLVGFLAAGVFNADAQSAANIFPVLAASAGEHNKARAHFGSAVNNAQSLADAESNMGKRYAKGDHQASAVTRFRAAVRKQTNLAVAYKWMATALRRWGRYAEMQKTLKMFGKHDPNGASSYRIEFKDSASLVERLGTVLYSYRKDLSKPL